MVTRPLKANQPNPIRKTHLSELNQTLFGHLLTPNPCRVKCDALKTADKRPSPHHLHPPRVVTPMNPDHKPIFGTRLLMEEIRILTVFQK